MRVQKLNEAAYAFSYNSEYMQAKREYERLLKCNSFMKDINTNIRNGYFKNVAEDTSMMRLSCDDTFIAVQREIEALCRKNDIPVDREETHNTVVYHIDSESNFTVSVASAPEGAMLQLNRG